MDRSLYPDGVEVSQENLTRTENTREYHILKRHVDNTLPGIVSGLQVTPNIGNGTLIDVSAGYGYAPNGELVELPSSINGISLASYIDGSLNIIALVYTETNENLKPHETSGDTIPTSAIRSYRLRIFTQSQYDALPTTDDNLENDSIDRAMIVAVIEAQGSGIVIPISAISSPSIYNSAITIENTTNNITGVSIVAAESGTPSGTASLSWSYNNGTLTWVAPEDISGNPVNILDGGLFELISAPSGRFLTVYVSSSLLPLSNQVDVIELSNLYYEQAPRHTSEDIQHRSLVGSGVPTINNPHGLTLADLGISGTPIEEHQVTFHSNGIRRDSNTNTLAITVNTATSPDELTVSVPSPFYVYLRGTLHNSSNDSFVAFDDILDNTYILYDIYATVGANNRTDIEKLERVRIDALSTFTDHVQLTDLSETTGAGAGSIEYDDGTKIIQYQAPGDSVGVGKVIPSSGSAFVRLFSNNNVDYIDLDINNTLSGTGNHSIPITVSARPTTIELKDKLLLSTVFYSGAGTGFLGNGFGVNNAPNTIKDKRLFGTTSPFDLRDDALPWFTGETSEAQSPSAITHRQVGIIDENYDYTSEPAYTDGRSQLQIISKAHVLGRNTDQVGTDNIIQYSTAEGGKKQGNRSVTIADFVSGTISDIIPYRAQVILSHTGTVFSAIGFASEAEINSGANVTNLAGFVVRAPTGTHSLATEIANQYGLVIEDQVRGVNNYAIKTGLGLHEIGDALKFTYGTGIEFAQAYIVGVPNIMQYKNIWRADTYPIIDGSSNPGEGFRISVMASLAPSVSLNDFMTADVGLSNQALVFEACDAGTLAPDGKIIFAGTGNDGIVEPFLVLDPTDGSTLPARNNVFKLGANTSRWNYVYANITDTSALRVGSSSAGLNSGDAIIMGGLALGVDLNPTAGRLTIGDQYFYMSLPAGVPGGTYDPTLTFNFDGTNYDYFRFDRGFRQHECWVNDILQFSVSESTTYSENRINLINAVLPSEYLPNSIDTLRSLHRRNIIGCWGYITTGGVLSTSFNVASYSGVGTVVSPWLINQNYQSDNTNTPILVSIFKSAGALAGTWVPNIYIQTASSFSIFCYTLGSPTTNPGLHFMRMAG